jgi:hypothetical protein
MKLVTASMVFFLAGVATIVACGGSSSDTTGDDTAGATGTPVGSAGQESSGAGETSSSAGAPSSSAGATSPSAGASSGGEVGMAGSGNPAGGAFGQGGQGAVAPCPGTPMNGDMCSNTNTAGAGGRGSRNIGLCSSGATTICFCQNATYRCFDAGLGAGGGRNQGGAGGGRNQGGAGGRAGRGGAGGGRNRGGAGGAAQGGGGTGGA